MFFSLSFLSLLCSQKMGKKSRVKTQKSGTGATASVSPKETLNLTSELLQSKFRSRLYVGCVPCRSSASSVLCAWESHWDGGA